MSDKELEEYFKTVEPNFNSHIEKGTIEMSNEYYNLVEERMARLIEKNRQLKEVIEEVREYTEELKPHWLGNDLVLKIIDDLLQILDKVKGEQ